MTFTNQASHNLHFILFQPKSNGFVFLFRADSILNEKTSHYIFGRGMITVCKIEYDFILVQFRLNVNLFIHY